MDSSRPVLLYDGDCGFCTTSALWAAEHLQPRDGRTVTVTPWQFADLDALAVAPDRPQREVVWIGADGDQRGGAAAAAALLQHRRGAFGLVGRAMDLPIIRSVAAAAYRLIARNRYRMPGGTPACALPPRR